MEINNLIVNYLPSAINDKEFRQLFAPYGPIVSSKVVCDKHGKSLCYGFVKYENSRNADDAVRNLNGMRIYNKVLKVGYALPQVTQSERADNLIVKNLPKTITTEQLEKIFGCYGKIIYIRILYEPTVMYVPGYGMNTPRLSKGIAFVRFEKLHDALQAMKALNNTTPSSLNKPIEIKMTHNYTKKDSNLPKTSSESVIPENKETVETTTRKSSWSAAKNLIIRNLNPVIDEISLISLFNPCGKVVWVKIARHRDGKSRQYGYVEMESPEDAMRVIQHLNGCFFMGHKLSVRHNNNLNTPPFSVRCDKNFKNTKHRYY